VPLKLDSLSFDCADPMWVAAFWAAALGFSQPDAESGPQGAWIDDPSGRTSGIYFQPVPEAKIAKNRVHLDLRPAVAMDAEVERLVGLGASVLGRVDEEGSFWTVMRDPEGNEFCVLRGPEDGWTPSEGASW
jgi:predicted enzyme related to lactoylglutathione lyase